MTPRDKAAQLLQEFKSIKRVFYVAKGKPLPTSEAKQCALILVNSHIDSIPRSPFPTYKEWFENNEF